MLQSGTSECRICSALRAHRRAQHGIRRGVPVEPRRSLAPEAFRDVGIVKCVVLKVPEGAPRSMGNGMTVAHPSRRRFAPPQGEVGGW